MVLTGGRGRGAARRAVLAGITLICAVGGPLLIGARDDLGTWAVPVGIALIAAAIALQVVQIYRDRRTVAGLDDERATLRRELRDGLKPIAELLAQLPALDYEARAVKVQVIAQAAVGALFALLSPHVREVRATVYSLSSDPDRMVWLAHVGRGQKPRPFVGGTTRGDAALEFIQELRPVLFPDLGRHRPDGYEGTMTDYRTFIAVPIWTDGSLYGMVTVDAPDPHSLSESDVYLAELVAELMAASFEVANVESLPDVARPE